MFYDRHISIDDLRSPMVDRVTDLNNHFEFNELYYHEDSREFRTWPNSEGEFKRFPVDTFNTAMFIFTTDEWKEMTYNMSCEIRDMIEHESRECGIEDLIKWGNIIVDDVNRLQQSYARLTAHHFKSLYCMRKLVDRFTTWDVQQACTLWCVLTGHDERLFIDPSEVDYQVERHFDC